MRRPRTGGARRAPQRPDPDAPMRITLEGTVAELSEAAVLLGDVLDLVDVSDPYDNADPARRGFGLQRLYLRAPLRPPPGAQPPGRDGGS